MQNMQDMKDMQYMLYMQDMYNMVNMPIMHNMSKSMSYKHTPLFFFKICSYMLNMTLYA